MRCSRALTFVLLVLFTQSLSGQTAQEIIARYLDTVSNGNIENWNQIKSLYTENEVYYSQQNFEQKIDLLKEEKGNYHKQHIVFPFKQKIEIYDDSIANKPLSTFYFLKDKTIILMGNMPPLVKEPAARDEFFSHHLPVQISKLVRKSKSVELRGVKQFTFDGTSCYEINISVRDRNYILYINTQTFLLEYWNGRGDGDATALTKFSNYKKVDGFLIPMFECSLKNGIVYFSNNVKKYFINVDIDPRIFDYKED